MSAQLQGYGFRYKHGDRPLEGYTVQHAAGRGGFGEVYYAVSDSGRQVALKALNGFEAIELRGVSQCMNLKSPHLVTVFDIRHNDLGQPFVIMEYVGGPSLRQMLDESPAGLGAQKSAFFLREIAKGLAYLHDCGIVHRDLKPANVFYENGTVKIGDYGLSKAIGASQHSAQTITVGTVHYMAPEVGKGQYDKRIDIYALGALLYELLTGQPPFLGGSPTEILMRHLSDAPNVGGIEEPFASVIRKAMAKDPNERFQNVQEMVEAVFGAEHVRQSVSVFSPDSLSMIAQRVAARVAAGPEAGSKTPPPIAGPLLGEAKQSWRAEPWPAAPASPRWLAAARYIWLGSLGVFLLTAVMLFIFMGVERLRDEEFVIALSAALACVFLALFSLWRVLHNVFLSWWQYVGRAMLLWLCFQSMITSGIVLGASRPGTEELLIGMFFILAPVFVLGTVGLAALIKRREGRGFPVVPPVPGRAAAFIAEVPQPPPAPAPPTPPAPPAPHLSATLVSGAQVSSARQWLLALVGYTVLILSFGLGLAMAIDAPGLAAVSGYDSESPTIYDPNGPPPRLMRVVGSAATWVGMLVSALLLATARRPVGVFHMLRAVVAVAALGGSCGVVYAAFNWSGGLEGALYQLTHYGDHLKGVRIAPTSSLIIDRYLQDAGLGLLIPAGLLMTLSLILLLWPAGRSASALLDGASASGGRLARQQHEQMIA